MDDSGIAIIIPQQKRLLARTIEKLVFLPLLIDLETLPLKLFHKLLVRRSQLNAVETDAGSLRIGRKRC